MGIKNTLLEEIHSWGFNSITPSEDLLLELGGMSAKRFFQILENRGKKEITMVEHLYISKWIKRVTGKDDILLIIENVNNEDSQKKHGLS